MGTQQTEQIMRYLRSLAPIFFSQVARGATDADIRRLEVSADSPIAETHRTFLQWVGNTPPGALNPFLNDRDFRVETLVAEYERIHALGARLPSRVAYFSVTESSGEVIYIRNSETVGDDPDVGFLGLADAGKDLAAENLTFFPYASGKLETHIASNAFEFRIGQLDFELEFLGRWDQEAERWTGDAAQVWNVFAQMGFLPVFSLADGSVCAQTDGLAVRVYSDGSGVLASNDRTELMHLREILREHAPSLVTFRFHNEASRLRAPRD